MPLAFGGGGSGVDGQALKEDQRVMFCHDGNELMHEEQEYTLTMDEIDHTEQ